LYIYIFVLDKFVYIILGSDQLQNSSWVLQDLLSPGVILFHWWIYHPRLLTIQ